ncbi:hypothetical protein MWMV14_MWMV14_01616 [Acinetobacter baumannii]|nr:hypothetical protein [Acinetobacter baumannii]MBU3167773.1 hypothetical protein [Acinetobacter baumannii]CAI3134096.1 hypothetical protein MWMV9_MWMV9_01550 [Acinetobacter baumannii]CAI3135359.1 hypothetical protein MWMV14_MWMV14_01616 [Acinetobacter baumannii]CAI3135734.1 hypothetical protein MWMV11_MWMV11_01615 [Acinetobacter baumannii]
MVMKFTAYDPVSKEKIYLKEYFNINKYSREKVYYRDEKSNFVYHADGANFFELEHYTIPFKVKINEKIYYLIGEY